MKKHLTENDYHLGIFITEAKHAYALEKFGDHLGGQKFYGKVKGFEAIHFYLVEKYRWTLSYARSLPYKDMRLLLIEEMKDWKLPEEFRAQAL